MPSKYRFEVALFGRTIENISNRDIATLSSLRETSKSRPFTKKVQKAKCIERKNQKIKENE